jgi:hypothetical protein
MGQWKLNYLIDFKNSSSMQPKQKECPHLVRAGLIITFRQIGHLRFSSLTTLPILDLVTGLLTLLQADLLLYFMTSFTKEFLTLVDWFHFYCSSLGRLMHFTIACLCWKLPCGIAL